MAEPYHRYVFDTEKRAFVGAFEEMYAREDEEGFDSWHQEDMSSLGRRVAMTVAAGLDAQSVLDVGCGKGAFSALLKRPGGQVLGVDLSQTAIAKARERHPDLEFQVMRVESLGDLEPRRFDLVVAMEVLSYVEDWRGALDLFRRLGDRLLVTLYVPPDPIGYVKSFDELIREVGRRYEIETEVLVNHEQIVLVGRARDD